MAISINATVVNEDDSLYAVKYGNGVVLGYISEHQREAILKGKRQLHTFYLKDIKRVEELKNYLDRVLQDAKNAK